MIPTLNVVCLFVQGALCILLPVGLLVHWCRSFRARVAPALYGALGFVLFALVLESLLHRVCLLGDHALARAIAESPWLYMLYGAFAAGIFEELGRSAIFSTVLRRETDRRTAVTAGLGHGGIEAVIVGASSIAYGVLALRYNAGGPDALAALAGGEEAVAALLPTLESASPLTCALAVVERMIAMAAHIGFSIYCFSGVRERKGGAIVLAVLLHALLDLPVGLYQRGVIGSIALVELCCAVIALSILRAARKRYLERL